MLLVICDAAVVTVTAPPASVKVRIPVVFNDPGPVVEIVPAPLVISAIPPMAVTNPLAVIEFPEFVVTDKAPAASLLEFS